MLELFEKTMRGDTPSVVAALGEMHDSGADPVVILQDLLELSKMEASSSEAERSPVERLAEIKGLGDAAITELKVVQAADYPGITLVEADNLLAICLVVQTGRLARRRGADTGQRLVVAGRWPQRRWRQVRTPALRPPHCASG